MAVSSPPGGVRSIVRITGPQTRAICGRVFSIAGQNKDARAGIHSGTLQVTDSLAIAARLYLFLSPHSYTGEDLAEIHLDAGPVIVETLVEALLALGLRSAGPGEFTARAYLNGKLDLAQAEAVNEVIGSSNRLQLDAAERLLGGRLAKAAEEVRSELVDILSLIEAGLDFSGEPIEFIGSEEAAQRLAQVQDRLEALLAGSIRNERLIDLPAVGIAGAPNAGKSSLLNVLLGWERSLTSNQAKTTRDVLTGVWSTERFQCVLFDCAGLIAAPHDVFDELAQQAAVEALRRCDLVLFCVDAAKTNWAEDIGVRAVIQPRSVIHVATKSDLLSDDAVEARVADLAQAFGADFLPVSVRIGAGLQRLSERCESMLADDASQTAGCSEAGGLALNVRHRQAVTDAIENVRHATDEVRQGNDEVAVLLIRSAHQAIAEIESQPIDEQVLDRIFSRFCIGK